MQMMPQLLDNNDVTGKKMMEIVELARHELQAKNCSLDKRIILILKICLFSPQVGD